MKKIKYISILIIISMILNLILPIVYATENTEESLTNETEEIKTEKTDIIDEQDKEESLGTNENSEVDIKETESIVEEENEEVINESDRSVSIQEISSEETLDSEQQIVDGEYKIRLAKSNAKLLNVKNGSTSNHEKIEIREDTNEYQNRFKITYLKDGYYKIESAKSGKVLDVPDQSKKPNTQIQQYEYNGTDAQKWIIKEKCQNRNNRCKRYD